MNKYIGTKVHIETKIVDAEPMVATESDTSSMHLIGTSGYHVKFNNGNCSWLSEQDFKDAYQLTDNMFADQALAAARLGYKVARHKWPDKTYLCYEISDDKAYTGFYLYLQSIIKQKYAHTYQYCDIDSNDWYIID